MDIQPVLFIQGAGSMHAPEGSGRLAAYLARELSTDYRIITPEMPDADNAHYQPLGIGLSGSWRRSMRR